MINAKKEDDSYKVDGFEVFTVKIIGVVDSLQEHSTNVTFKINDGTGSFECKQWIEKNSAASSKISNTRLIIFIVID